MLLTQILLDVLQLVFPGSGASKFPVCCQTPNPVQNWELTLLSHGNKKNKNPHLNSPRRGCAGVLKFCMCPRLMKFACRPQLLKELGCTTKQISDTPTMLALLLSQKGLSSNVKWTESKTTSSFILHS